MSDKNNMLKFTFKQSGEKVEVDPDTILSVSEGMFYIYGVH